jgi:hypothetical protein
MIHRWTSTNPEVITAIRPRQPKRAVSPRVRQSVEPLPIDWRRGLRSIRLAIGAAICAVIGHKWRRLVWVQYPWVPEARSHRSVYLVNRRRTCDRCEQQQSRSVGGQWGNSN